MQSKASKPAQFIFSYKGYPAYRTFGPWGKTPACIIYDGQWDCHIILVNEIVPDLFLVSVLEHEAVEHSLWGDHESGKIASYKKAAELGLEEDFKNWERDILGGVE